MGNLEFVDTVRVSGHLFNTEVRRNFYCQKVINVLNCTPQRTMETKSLYIFKDDMSRCLFHGRRDEGLWEWDRAVAYYR